MRKSNGFANFENTVDRGSAVIFDADSGLCLPYVLTLGPKGNLDHRSFFSHDRYVNEFIQPFLFSREVHFNSGVRLLLELCCVNVIKHVAFFTIWVKLTVAFTCTSLPLNHYTSVFRCGCSFGFEQKQFGGSMNLAKKRHGSADLHTPIHPPPNRFSAKLPSKISTKFLRNRPFFPRICP